MFEGNSVKKTPFGGWLRFIVGQKQSSSRVLTSRVALMSSVFFVLVIYRIFKNKSLLYIHVVVNDLLYHRNCSLSCYVLFYFIKFIFVVHFKFIFPMKYNYFCQKCHLFIFYLDDFFWGKLYIVYVIMYLYIFFIIYKCTWKQDIYNRMFSLFYVHPAKNYRSFLHHGASVILI